MDSSGLFVLALKQHNKLGTIQGRLHRHGKADHPITKYTFQPPITEDISINGRLMLDTARSYI